MYSCKFTPKWSSTAINLLSILSSMSFLHCYSSITSFCKTSILSSDTFVLFLRNDLFRQRLLSLYNYLNVNILGFSKLFSMFMFGNSKFEKSPTTSCLPAAFASSSIYNWYSLIFWISLVPNFKMSFSFSIPYPKLSFWN